MVISLLMVVVTVLSMARVEPFGGVIGGGYDYVVTDGIYGIVIDEAFAPRFVSERRRDEVEGYWTPTREEVARAEQLVRSERGTDRQAYRDLAQERYADRLAVGGRDAIDDAVSRQYHGVIENGTRLLYINANLRGLPADPLAPMIVLDGGPGFWMATINADSWTVESYSENGNA